MLPASIRAYSKRVFRTKGALHMSDRAVNPRHVQRALIVHSELKSVHPGFPLQWHLGLFF